MVEHGLSVAGEGGACVISEKTQVDLASLVGAVRTDVVFQVFGIVVLVVAIGIVVSITSVSVAASLVVVVIVVLEVTAHVEVLALGVVRNIEVSIKFAGSVVVLVVLGVLVSGLHVGSEEGAHVHNVVSVLGGAAIHVALAVGGRAETETNKALGHDADIFFVVGVFVPLLNVVAALELEAVSSKEAGVDVLPVILFVFFVVLNTTGVVQELTANGRVGCNVAVVLVDYMLRTNISGKESKSKNRKTSQHGDDNVSKLDTYSVLVSFR